MVENPNLKMVDTVSRTGLCPCLQWNNVWMARLSSSHLVLGRSMARHAAYYSPPCAVQCRDCSRGSEHCLFKILGINDKYFLMLHWVPSTVHLLCHTACSDCSHRAVEMTPVCSRQMCTCLRTAKFENRALWRVGYFWTLSLRSGSNSYLRRRLLHTKPDELVTLHSDMQIVFKRSNGTNANKIKHP